MPEGVTEEARQLAREAAREAEKLLDAVVLPTMGGDRRWNTLSWWSDLQNILLPAVALAEQRRHAYMDQQPAGGSVTEQAHPADVLALAAPGTNEWTARTSQVHSAATRLMAAAQGCTRATRQSALHGGRSRAEQSNLLQTPETSKGMLALGFLFLSLYLSVLSLSFSLSLSLCVSVSLSLRFSLSLGDRKRRRERERERERDGGRREGRGKRKEDCVSVSLSLCVVSLYLCVSLSLCISLSVSVFLSLSLSPSLCVFLSLFFLC